MARVKPLEIIKGLRGKVCEHSDLYFRTNRITGAVFTGKLCNPSESAASSEQRSARDRFKKVGLAIRARISSLETDVRKVMMSAYKSQRKIGSFFGFCFKKWNDEYDENGDLKV